VCITACRVLAASRHSMCCWRALGIVIMRWIWLAHYFTCSSWSVCVDVPFRECSLSTSLSLFHREYQTGVEDGLFTRYYFTTLPSRSHWSLPVSSHTHTHTFNGPFPRTTRVGKNNLDFTEARDTEWQWHQLGHMQVCTLLQTDNHASTSPLRFLHAGCPFCHPTNSVKALKASCQFLLDYS